MSTVRKTITLTEQQNEWVKLQITIGQFTNDSEYIRALVRRDQEKNNAIMQIRAALIEGEVSGVSTRTAEQIKQDVQEKLRKDGQL